MTIPVTTRSGKGIPLTTAEMDTNLTDLARNSTTTQQGNVELATTAEADTGTDTTTAVTPEGVLSSIVANAPAEASFVQSINGSYLDPNTNFLFQWGKDTLGSGITTINFHTAFDSAALNVMLTQQRDTTNQTDANYMVLGTPTATTFDVFVSSSFSGPVFWTAIGIKT